MADHSKPLTTSTYANFVTELDGRFDDITLGLDPAVTTPTNVPTNAIRWNSASNKWQKYDGSTWNNLSSTYDFTSITGTSLNISGNTTLGDASGDTVTLNASTVSIPNGLNFDSDTLVIDATNNRVGIGTSSPAYILETANTVAGDFRGFSVNNKSTNTSGQSSLSFNTANDGTADRTRVVLAGFASATGNDGVFTISNRNAGTITERLRLDSSGNLGLGVTPYAWSSAWRSLDIGNSTSIMSYLGSTPNASVFANNYYYNGTNYVYKNTGYASNYGQNNGIHYWNIAPSGTAGNAITFTQAMTLDASGNLLLGTTSNPAGYRMNVSGTTPVSFNTVNNTSYAASGATTASPDGTAIFNFNNNTAAADKFNGVIVGSLGGTGAGQYSYFGAVSTSSGFAPHTVFGVRSATSSYTERMRIDSSGNVGIGTSSPTEKLSILGGASAAGYISLRGNNNASSSEFLLGQASDGTTTYAFNRANGVLVFGTNNTERMRIDASGNVGIGVTPSAWQSSLRMLQVDAGSSFGSNGSIDRTDVSANWYYNAGDKYIGTGYASAYRQISGVHRWYTAASGTAGNAITFTNAMTLNAAGILMTGKTAAGIATAGAELSPTGDGKFTVDGNICIYVNRLTSDGTLVSLRQAGTEEGTISVSGTTVSYNGGHLARWSQLLDGSKDDTLLKGTVLTNLDEMCVWTKDGEQLPNEQLNKMKVSDVEGDTNVAGVFVNWTRDEDCNTDDMNIAMTGDMIIRIAQGVTVNRGDLLMSAGDGTAKPQGDDIVRSKTIAKVTSTNITCTYADGSYCVPCVLMAC